MSRNATRKELLKFAVKECPDRQKDKCLVYTKRLGKCEEGEKECCFFCKKKDCFENCPQLKYLKYCRKEDKKQKGGVRCQK